MPERGTQVVRWALLSLLVCPVAPLGADTIPKNLSGDLRALLTRPAAAARAFAVPQEEPVIDQDSLRVTDVQGRVLVKILLDGRVPLAAVKERLEALEEVRVTATSDSYRAGVIEAFVPAGQLVGVATAKGVSSVVSVSRPVHEVGAVTTQGIVQHRIDKLPAGLDGAGITVGALSDSYDTDLTAPTSAADDVATGDLPPDVQVLEDFDGGADEGRAMLQIVHDIAPDGAARLRHGRHGRGRLRQQHPLAGRACPARRTPCPASRPT